MQFDIGDLLGGGTPGADSFTGTDFNVPMDWRAGQVDLGGTPGAESFTGGAPAGGSSAWQQFIGSAPNKAGEGGSGLRGAVSEVGSVAKDVAPLFQIGAGLTGAAANIYGAGQIANQTQMANRATRSQLQSAQQARDVAGQVSAPAGTLTNFGTEQLRRAEAGQLDPALESYIDQWKAGAKQLMLQRLSSSGQANSSTAEQVNQFIERQAIQIRAGMLEQMKTQGVGATQAGGGLLVNESSVLTGAGQAAGGAAQTAQQQSAVLANLIAGANQALARLGASAST